jgi:hypothetical protein
MGCAQLTEQVILVRPVACLIIISVLVLQGVLETLFLLSSVERSNLVPCDNYSCSVIQPHLPGG